MLTSVGMKWIIRIPNQVTAILGAIEIQAIQGAGNVSKTSGLHGWNGAHDILKSKAHEIRPKLRPINSGSAEEKTRVKAGLLKDIVPERPYMSETPYRNIADVAMPKST